MKKILKREDCENLLEMVRLGRARIVKEHSAEGPAYLAFLNSGKPIGIVGDKHKYMFEEAIINRGSDDGLFEGCSQTTELQE